jgi:hypothetical protein
MGQRHRDEDEREGRRGRAGRVGRTILATLALVLATTIIGFGSPPAGAAPTADATPTTDLVDGSLVHLSLTDFSPGATVVVDECGAPIATCRTLLIMQADATGSLSVTVRVFAVLSQGGATVDCRTVTTCGLVAYTTGLTVESTTHLPLAFVAGSPLAPPTFVATPSTGLSPGDPITFSGTGLNADADIDIYRCSVDFPSPGGVSCAEDRSYRIPVRTDSAGSFSTTVALAVDFATDLFFGSVPLPDPGCPATGACEIFALIPALPDTALTVAVGYTPLPATTTSTTTTTVTAPPAAVPVRVVPAFTG